MGIRPEFGTQPLYENTGELQVEKRKLNMQWLISFSHAFPLKRKSIIYFYVFIPLHCPSLY